MRRRTLGNRFSSVWEKVGRCTWAEQNRGRWWLWRRQQRQARRGRERWSWTRFWCSRERGLESRAASGSEVRCPAWPASSPSSFSSHLPRTCSRPHRLPPPLPPPPREDPCSNRLWPWERECFPERAEEVRKWSSKVQRTRPCQGNPQTLQHSSVCSSSSWRSWWGKYVFKQKTFFHWSTHSISLRITSGSPRVAATAFTLTVFSKRVKVTTHFCLFVCLWSN